MNEQEQAQLDQALSTLAHLDMEDEPAELLGANLAEALKLRRDPDHKDRWQTTWGTYTNKGIARVILRFMVRQLARPTMPAHPLDPMP